MTEAIYWQKARDICAELRMFGSPARGEHLGAKQSGTILWERDGWPFVESKIAQALAETEEHHLRAIKDLQRTVQNDGARMEELRRNHVDLIVTSLREGARIAKLEDALRVAQVAFDYLDPANHHQTTDGELAKLITTARQTVSDAIKGVA